MKSSPVTAALLSAVRQLIKTLTALNVRLIPYGQVRLAVKIHVDAENLPRTPGLVRFTALSPRKRHHILSRIKARACNLLRYSHTVDTCSTYKLGSTLVQFSSAKGLHGELDSYLYAPPSPQNNWGQNCTRSFVGRPYCHGFLALMILHSTGGALVMRTHGFSDLSSFRKSTSLARATAVLWPHESRTLSLQ